MRNEESHFSVNPTNLDIGRSRFSRPFDHKTTFDVGELIPFYWSEILPGDTVEMKTSKVVRLSTLLDPVMDNLFLDTYYFFVPMRLVWDHTKEFFGENTSGPWYPSTTYSIPQIMTDATRYHEPGTILDYMGVPPRVKGISISALPVRSYTKVFMDWFIDQMTMTPPVLYTGDSDRYYSTSSVDGGAVYIASKLHDYFSSSTPAPQRGPSVMLPVGGTGTITIDSFQAPVVAASSLHNASQTIRFGGSSSDSLSYLARYGAIDNIRDIVLTNSSSTDPARVNWTNLVADLSSGSSGTFVADSDVSINDLRLAFQMQKWYEKSALYGGRYIEMLKAQFGVTSPDARLQRSEYLGGNRIPLNVTQVENTAASTSSEAQPLGHLGAYSATSDYNVDFTHSFTEHGFLLGICVARYKHSYPQGIERSWSRKTMFDYYFPVFANIGNQPVLRKEIYATGDSVSDEAVWGYQEAWSDYRYHPDRVSSMFRPNITGNLASWHYADNYGEAPILSSGWMQESKSNVDRTLAVTSAVHDQLIADFYCDATFVRAMPLYSIPGLIDHH